MPQEQVTVAIKRLPGAEDIPLPAYQTDHAAAMDIHAAVEDPVEIPRGGICVIPGGFAIALPPGYEAQIRPRSGLASKRGLSIPNTPATIDADYRGEVRIPLVNLGTETFRRRAGDANRTASRQACSKDSLAGSGRASRNGAGPRAGSGIRDKSGGSCRVRRGTSFDHP